MFLDEPQRTPYDLNFRLFGIPVRISPWFWAVSAFLGLSGGRPDIKRMLIWVAAVFISILVHEMGHAFAARAHGWQPWVTLHGMGGLASYRPTHHSPLSKILISLAGPGAGFVLAAVVIAVIRGLGHAVTFDSNSLPSMPFEFALFASPALNIFFLDMLFVNIFWGLVNLLPIYPLDGGQISREVFDVVQPRDGVRISLWVSIFAAAGMALYGLKMGDTFIALFFAMMAYSSYMAIQQLNRGGWGGY